MPSGVTLVTYFVFNRIRKKKKKKKKKKKQLPTDYRADHTNVGHLEKIKSY